MEAEKLAQLHQAIDALAELGDTDSAFILSLIDRMLADDWSQTDLFANIDKIIKAEESIAATA